jgi:uncharacterized delta-60 repeat protein
MKKARLFVFAGISIIAVTLIFALGGMPSVGSSAAQNGGGQAELLAGRNVNMVAGTRLPWGDPWLQRQNEPSLAASSRNPMHFLAGANDYRTVDIPDDFKVPGIPPQANARDAWLGVFKSFDGGQSWITTLLPGFPQDSSNEGLSSPIHGFDAACDPCVRAGSNGMFYYSGIAFNRAGGAGGVFLARYIDFNNLEEVKKSYKDDPDYPNNPWQWTVKDDPIRYVNAKIIDNCNPGQFIDMPSIVADVPRGALPGSTMIKGQNVLNASVYMAYTVFLGNFDVNVRSRLMFVRSANCGETWSAPIKLSESQHIIQRAVIAIDPSDSTGNRIYVAFRRFAFGNMAGGIAICKSVDGGRTFTKPIEVETLLYPFDQVMDGSKFRTNSYPTMAVDGAGRVHIAWAQRLAGPTTQSRIVLKTSPDGVVWANPAVIVGNDPSFLGNQFMPALTFAAGRLLLAWYDQRETVSPDNASGAVADTYPNRQTIDVRACEAIPGPVPIFGPSYQVSRYLYYLELDGNGNPIPDGDYFKAIQAEYNPPNLPIFQLGKRPFDGDYIDLAAAPLILPPPVAGGSWAYNTAEGHPVTFHSAWADNRDVRPPADGWWGNWANYTPPASPQDYAYTHAGGCDANGTGMRNQNVYTASIGKGVFVGSPGNTKQLDLENAIPGGRRTFVVLVKNFTDYAKTLQMVIPNISGGGTAWFKQDGTEKTMDIVVPAYSSYSATVYVDHAGGQLLPVRVDVNENGSLVGYALLNPDPLNLPVDDPDSDVPAYLTYEKHTPRVQNPRVYNYDLGNQSDPNPRVMNPRVQNPRVMNPRVMNPRVQNESLINQEVSNPRVMNPRVQNTSLTDVTWVVSNEGNTTSAFTFNIFSTVDTYFNGENPPLIGQVLVYKVHLVPGAYNCDLYETHEDELLVNYTNPRVQNPRVQNNVPDEGSGMTTQALGQEPNEELPKDVTFYLAPGEEAYVTFRVWDDNTLDNISFSAQTVTAYVEAEAISTGGTAPEYALPEDGVPWVTHLPQIGTSQTSLSFYAMPGTLPPGQQFNVWNAGDGTLDYTITVEAPWLNVTPPSGSSGTHSVTVTDATLPIGVYRADVVITDPNASNNPFRIPVTLVVSTSPGPVLSEWVARYNGPGNLADWSRAIAVDAADNVYVTGSASISAGDQDFVTIKYDSSGNQLWMALYDGGAGGNDFPNAIAVDAAGNVIVTGRSTGVGTGTDYATVKYNSTGAIVWAARYNGPANGYDVANGVAVDPAGNVYVTGSASVGTGMGQSDIVTIRYYAATGNTAWTAFYNGPGSWWDDGIEIALDAAGNVYVAGETGSSSGNADFVTLKYSSAGVQAWAAYYNGPGNQRDGAFELAVDPAGNAYVAGVSIGAGTGYDYATVKYNTAGTELWASRYASAGALDDVTQELIIGPDGNAYVTGYSTRTGFLRDIVTVKYDGASGGQLWQTKYSAPGDSDNEAFELALGPTGKLFLAGGSTGASGEEDILTVRYNAASGQQEWVRRYHGAGEGDDYAHEVVIDTAGNVFVAGNSYGAGTDQDIVTIKYGPDLEEWRDEYNGPDNGDDEPQAITVDSSGNVYVAASTERADGTLDYLTIKYGPAGNKLWEVPYNGPANARDVPSAIAVDAAGNVFVTGSSYGVSSDRDFATIMYDSAGNPVWTQRFNRSPSINGEDSAHAIALGSDGVYVTGRSYHPSFDFDWVTIKYSFAGAELWNTAYDHGGGDWPFAMAVDAAGDVYVTGESVRVEGGVPQTDTEMTTIKYSGATGAQLAIDRYHLIWNMGSTSINQAVDIAIREVAGETMIVVTGIGDNYEAGSAYATIRYDTNLVRQWEETYNETDGGFSIPANVEIDPEGNVFVTGESPGGAVTGLDFVTIKYGPDSTQLWVRRLNGAASLDDSPASMAVDDAGNAYVTGWSTGLGGLPGYLTVKYDPAGVERWQTSFWGTLLGDDAARAITVDVDNNVLLTGRSKFFAIGPPPHYNIVTFKYRKEGF